MNEVVLLLSGGVNSTVATLTAGARLVVDVAAALLPDSQTVSAQLSVSLSNVKDAVLPSLEKFMWWLDFTPQQSHVLNSLLGILLINLILILVFWHVYAHRISHTLSFSKLTHHGAV
ncbi:hypothetical protein GWK47_044687 [Chionoecetes opilio]|uniref:Uncharacterized protein n=1 Tax=Chionoecetes opilio TaxID=41210 RepID=A0A8J4Y8W8_CHIOP|nr:hypothetical protein GWK47_044687 [Chionoecetes opilio]